MAAFEPATPMAMTADQQRTANATNTAADPSSAAAGIIIDRVQLQEGLKRAAEKVDAEFSKNASKIHRYPAVFRGLMSKDDRYFVPRCVAIGPYHHRAVHLQRAEEMKRAAAYYICEASGHSAEVIYARILSVAGEARSCYDHDAVAGIPQADFATMMFLDGCFLLQYIVHSNADAINPRQQSLSCWFEANGESILRDIFLLENQLPWLVLEALMSFLPVHHVDVGEFISDLARSFETQQSILGDDTSALVLKGSYKPAHLLDLLHHYQSGSNDDVPASQSRTLFDLPTGITSLPQSTSAIHLAESGIQLRNNRTAKFGDMGLGKGLFFCKLFLAPLVMDDLNACWLLNMVAFETSLATWDTRPCTTVRSYVLLIGMLMNREEDVHELRVKRILHGKFSDQLTLSFMKDLSYLIFLTNEHVHLMLDLEDYRSKRRMWISLHKFIYNNFKYIVTVFSITGVLVGIFKALFSISMKQH